MFLLMIFSVLTILSSGCNSTNAHSPVEDTGPYEMVRLSDSSVVPSVNILKHQIIYSPITITVNSQGAWLGHEGELGVMKLLNQEGKELTSAIMSSKDGNWMTSEAAQYIATLEFDPGDARSGTLVLENKVITSEGDNRDKSMNIPVRFSREPVETYCFASKTPAMNAAGESNYHFLRFEKDKFDHLHGVSISAPFGIDGSRASLIGTWHATDQRVQINQRQLAEGVIYHQESEWSLFDDGIELDFQDPRGEPAILPRITCDEYESLYREFEGQVLHHQINTTDRTRLLELIYLEGFGFTKQELQKVRFLEREIDLDHSYETREFLLYLLDPMVCGTGGCTLFVMNDEGEVLSQTSVTKLPLFTTTNLASEQKPGSWKDLYVWSNGSYRQLIYRDGSYSNNASMAPAMAERNLTGFPEKYFKIMDYMD